MRANALRETLSGFELKVPLISTTKARENCLSEKILWVEAYCFVAVLIRS